MTGRYKAYPEYKKSGVEWLGEIPADWVMSKLAYTYTQTNAGEVIDKSYWGSGKETLYTCNRNYLRSDYLIFPNKKRTTKQDLLLTRNGTPYVHKPIVNAIYSNVVQRITLQERFDRDYLAYCLSNSALNLKGYGVSIESLNFENWQSLSFAFPIKEEQQKIANFLDHETAKIDTLITKQEKLIELLKEKLLANRYHTVTKGLNPDVSFVETGISWTPLAPEHWSQVPNRSVMSMRRVLVGQNYRNYQLLSLTKKGVLVRNISSGEGKQSDHLDRTQEVRKGDLVFCLFDVEETPRTVGLSHHLGMISGDYTVFECSNPNMARFLEYFYKAMDDRKLLKPLYRGLRKRIPKPGFLRVSIPVPPKEELENILQSLDYLEEKIEQLTHLADKQVTILKERKVALISAAVTGKIDVRDWSVN